jgi:hypothetical protein
VKITVERAELLPIITDSLKAKFGGEWECTDADYHIPRELTFQQVTEATIAAAAKEKAELAVMRAKRAAEESARPTTAETADAEVQL